VTETVFSPIRSIGDIVIDCTVQEQAVDELEITSHPVERSANISDHAIDKPCVLTFRAGWSNSSPEASGDSGYAQDIYDQMLALKQSKQPVAVVSGKRTIETALIKTVAWANDHTTDQALFLDITIQEILLVDTVVAAVPTAAVQASPQKTAATTQSGTIQAVPSSVVLQPSGGG
jgi:hypothetical protein